MALPLIFYMGNAISRACPEKELGTEREVLIRYRQMIARWKEDG